MKKSKLIDLLSKFDQDEITRLKDFMSSPYFFQRESLINFGKMILNLYPNFEQDLINEIYIYNKLFPGQKFKGQTINDLMNSMVSGIYKFLALENFLSDDLDVEFRTMEELRKKDIANAFLRASVKIQKKIEESKKDDKYYFNLMKFEEEFAQYYINMKEQFRDSKYFQKKSDALDLYYLASKLKIVSNFINDQNIFSSQYDFSLLPEILTYVSTNLHKFEDIPAVKIYYRIILTLTKPEEEENFYTLISELENATPNFTTSELRDMYGFAHNYCIKKLNSGKVEFVNELFKLYRKLLESGIIFENGNLSQWDYKNITSIGLRLNQFDWVENFIIENKNRILPSFREVAFNFNMANFYYVKKEFKKTSKLLLNFHEALSQIDDPNFDNTFYNLDYRTLLLKVYFESNDEEPFHAIIRSFKLFLERNKKVSERNRIIYLNLLKYSKKLSDIRTKIGFKTSKELKLSILKLKNSIEAEQNIVSLPWLLTQVQELEKELNHGGIGRHG